MADADYNFGKGSWKKRIININSIPPVFIHSLHKNTKKYNVLSEKPSDNYKCNILLFGDSKDVILQQVSPNSSSKRVCSVPSSLLQSSESEELPEKKKDSSLRRSYSALNECEAEKLKEIIEAKLAKLQVKKKSKLTDKVSSILHNISNPEVEKEKNDSNLNKKPVVKNKNNLIEFVDQYNIQIKHLKQRIFELDEENEALSSKTKQLRSKLSDQDQRIKTLTNLNFGL